MWKVTNNKTKIRFSFLQAGKLWNSTVIQFNKTHKIYIIPIYFVDKDNWESNEQD